MEHGSFTALRMSAVLLLKSGNRVLQSGSVIDWPLDQAPRLTSETCQVLAFLTTDRDVVFFRHNFIIFNLNKPEVSEILFTG